MGRGIRTIGAVEFEEYVRAVGRRIRKARWIAGLTQEQVAAQGINYRYYQEVERGARNPSLRTLFLLGRILDVPPSLFLEVEPARQVAETREHFEKARPEGPRAGRKPKRGKGP